MTKKSMVQNILIGLMYLCLTAGAAFAQTTAFSYQGRLNDAGAPANANYDLQFRLFDALAGGVQQGATITNPALAVNGGIFSLELDFGLAAFNGSARWLEISVRPAGSANPYTVLAPRQAITATPYSVRSMASGASDVLSAACVDCVTSTQVQNIDGAKITGAVAGSQISGAIPAGSVPTGSGNYIQNSMAALRAGQPQGAQEGSFSITGDGTFGGILSANQYNLGGNRVLSADSANNLFAGIEAGLSNTTGIDNTFIGAFAGRANVAGGANTFVGVSAGFNNLSEANSFYGRSAGFQNTTGASNSFVGTQAGRDNSTGSNNSFFGRAAGIGNATGVDNTFVGAFAGQANGAGGANSFFGVSAGFNNTGTANAFFGRSAGFQNTIGIDNSFFGTQAGRDNSTGNNNSFFGRSAGIGNSTGFDNTFVGAFAGQANGGGDANSFFGVSAGFNSTGEGNAFFGRSAGFQNTGGFSNSFFGTQAGRDNAAGNDNSFFGRVAGLANTTGSANTIIGSNANVGAGNLSNATALGANALVSQSNSLVLGNNANVGIGTSAPVAKLHVVGTTRTSLLQVTGGLDLAENFDFAEMVTAGMVVAIDSRQAGKLVVARGAYNRRVAGVISGANNLAAGMVLSGLSKNDNSSPVALSGRVWVYCDAAKRPIKPGDLLTTSNTPGHAMKVTNHRRAQGAIIGKAMTGLQSGRGLVLVLVSLQ